MVVVAQLVRAPDCGSGGRGFEPRLPPLKIRGCPVLRQPLLISIDLFYSFFPYFTSILIPSLWLVNSGAYIHWMVVIPLLKLPLCCTLSGYSKT